ncbi:MAG: polysaccharide deacetylase family protein, partial [Planctomycetes bacterium]|nr:polysaccharide deacetylase family protein [Planctomycetota bacterium]
MKYLRFFAIACGLFFQSVLDGAQPSLEKIPDKLVVLTFDDSVKSHFTQARPILKQYGFKATFFIT